MRVLIAEDDAIIAMMMQDAVTDAGHECIGPVSTMGQALDLAQVRRPDCALVDVALRDGDTGYQLARDLRQRWAVESVIVSGMRPGDVAADASFGFIAKPFTEDELLDMLARFFRGAGDTFNR